MLHTYVAHKVIFAATRSCQKVVLCFFYCFDSPAVDAVFAWFNFSIFQHFSFLFAKKNRNFTMVVPSATSRDAVLELVKQKEAVEQKIADQGKILEAVSITDLAFKLRIVIP